MTQEQVDNLMKLRVKVTRYPHYPFDGDILIEGKDGEMIHETEGYPQSIYKITKDDVEKYPAYFRKMPWWEDRMPEEMPEYVKYWDTSLYYPVDRVAKISDNPFAAYNFTAENFQPATEQEYLNYQQSKPKQ